MRNELPETCFATLPGTGDLIILKRGETGYYPSEWDTGDRTKNREIADYQNYGHGIIPAQVQAMMVGSMYGFHVPGADPQIYFDKAKLIHIYTLDLDRDVVKEPVVSTYIPVRQGSVYQYQIAGQTQSYLDVSAMPDCLLGKTGHFTIFRTWC